jgi:hypothetical protein
MFAHDTGRRARTGGGRYGNVMSFTLENFRGSLDQSAAVFSQFARTWIVDDNRIPVSCDGELSRFLVVKL